MNIYANAFNLATRRDGTGEFVISFRQESPDFNEQGKVIGTKIETVGSFVISEGLAKELSRQIAELAAPAQPAETAAAD